MFVRVWVGGWFVVVNYYYRYAFEQRKMINFLRSNYRTRYLVECGWCGLFDRLVLTGWGLVSIYVAVVVRGMSFF